MTCTPYINVFNNANHSRRSGDHYGCELDDVARDVFFFKQKTAYDVGLGIPAEPLFRSNVLPQLDINNTIDHRPEGDEKWFLENEKTVTQFCRKLAAERPLKDIRDEYNYPKKKGIKDECSRL